MNFLKPAVVSCVCGFGLTVFVAAAAGAVSPREELLRFVPEDVAFCVVLQDLRGHVASLQSSPLLAQFRNSTLGKALAETNETRQLLFFRQQLKMFLELDLDQVRDDVLGDAVVFAYKPGPPDKPEREQGLLLIRARKEKVLCDLVERLNRVQQAVGEVKSVEEREHKGVKYLCRTETKGTTFYHLRGPILVFSGQEEMLQQALEQADGKGKDEIGLARSLKDLGSSKVLLTIWLNPRAFDAQLAAATRRAVGAESFVLKHIALYWHALQDAALMVQLDRDLSLVVSARARMQQLPAPAVRFLSEAAKPTDLWQLCPANALLAIAGRCDAVALTEIVSDFIPLDKRRALQGELERTVGAALGMDLAKEVLPQTGPGLAWCLTAPGKKNEWLPRGFLAIALSAREGASAVDQVVLSVLNSFALLGVLVHNHHHPDRPLTIKSLHLDDCDAKLVVGDLALPPGVRPTLGLKKGYLVLASSPDAFQQFGTKSGIALPPGETPLLRMSLKTWRDFLQDRREILTREAAARNHLPAAEVARRLDGLLAGLQWFERLDVGVRTSAGMATLTIRLRPELPLLPAAGK